MFSRFIPCCVHEGIYIIDELIKNESDVQPDTIIRGDTQAQNGPASIDRELIDADVLKMLFALSAGAYQSLWGLSVGFAEEGAAALYKHNFRL